MKENALDDLKAELKLGSQIMKVKLLCEEVPSPPEEVKIKAQIQLCNNMIFEAIQEV